MCGIFGYIGKSLARGVLLDGLARLEYRGYDSCGIASVGSKGLTIDKAMGRIANLREKLGVQTEQPMTIGVAHTRWATHGRPSDANSHPHTGTNGRIAAVHNGIIENFEELRQELTAKGHKFVSQTDTEVIPQLIEEYYSGDIVDATFKAIARLDGSFAVCVFTADDPDTLIGFRKDSPMVVGVCADGYLIASDSIALLPYTKKELCLNDGELVVLRKDRIELFDFAGVRREATITEIVIDSQDAEKGEFAHYMLKEINEQPGILYRLAHEHLRNGSVVIPEFEKFVDQLKNIEKLYIIACGTAYHAGYVGKYLLERCAGFDVEIDVSSESRYRDIRLKKNSMVLAVSQSGETADTLAAVKRFKKLGASVISICNVKGSSLTRVADATMYTLCGPEVGVASTKAYTSQVFCVLMMALYIASLKGEMTPAAIAEIAKEAERIPALAKQVIESSKKVVEEIAAHYSKLGCFLFLGRNLNYPTAMEGALKLKELSYIPAEGYAAGEMKHGPIALIDEYRAVVCVAPHDALYEKMFSNIQEIKARKGRVLAIVTEGDTKVRALADECIEIPVVREELSPLLAVIPLQFLAYDIARNLGYDIDKPRNLAKSVTVE